jgi:hypothetical protein
MVRVCLLYADDVSTLGGSVHTVKENTGAGVDANNEIGLGVNVERNVWSRLERRVQDEVTSELNKICLPVGDLNI